VQEATLKLERADRNKDLSQAPQLYKVSKNEFKRSMEYVKPLILRGKGSFFLWFFMLWLDNPEGIKYKI
jgi:hypothetical protein